MQLMNDETRYGAIAQVLHWLVVILIIAQVVLASRAHALPLGPAKLVTLAQHKSVGMTVLMLAVVRLIWRAVNRQPTSVGPDWQRRLARLSHFLLYASLVTLPILGWLMSSARNFPVSWFGVFTFPDLIAPDNALYEFFRKAHGTLAKLFVVLALGHMLAALKHHFIDRDDVLRRMLPGAGRRS